MRKESLEFLPLGTQAQARLCAEMMCSSEPWITLRRSFDDSLALLRDPGREVYVATENDQVRGFIILNMQGPFAGYIQTICVDSSVRSSGIGTQLIRFAEERIFGQTPNVFLCVSSFNPRARALYERLGYELIGELKDYLIRGASELLMRKTIGPLKG